MQTTGSDIILCEVFGKPYSTEIEPRWLVSDGKSHPHPLLTHPKPSGTPTRCHCEGSCSGGTPLPLRSSIHRHGGWSSIFRWCSWRCHWKNSSYTIRSLPILLKRFNLVHVVFKGSHRAHRENIYIMFTQDRRRYLHRISPWNWSDKVHGQA